MMSNSIDERVVLISDDEDEEDFDVKIHTGTRRKFLHRPIVFERPPRITCRTTCVTLLVFIACLTFLVAFLIFPMFRSLEYTIHYHKTNESGHHDGGMEDHGGHMGMDNSNTLPGLSMEDPQHMLQMMEKCRHCVDDRQTSNQLDTQSEKISTVTPSAELIKCVRDCIKEQHGSSTPSLIPVSQEITTRSRLSDVPKMTSRLSTVNSERSTKMTSSQLFISTKAATSELMKKSSQQMASTTVMHAMKSVVSKKGAVKATDITLLTKEYIKPTTLRKVNARPSTDEPKVRTYEAAFTKPPWWQTWTQPTMKHKSPPPINKTTTTRKITRETEDIEPAAATTRREYTSLPSITSNLTRARDDTEQSSTTPIKSDYTSTTIATETRTQTLVTAKATTPFSTEAKTTKLTPLKQEMRNLSTSSAIQPGKMSTISLPIKQQQSSLNQMVITPTATRPPTSTTVLPDTLLTRSTVGLSNFTSTHQHAKNLAPNIDKIDERLPDTRLGLTESSDRNKETEEAEDSDNILKLTTPSDDFPNDPWFDEPNNG